MRLDVTFETKAYNRVRNQLRRLASDRPDITEPVMERHAKMQSAMFRSKPYPPKRAGQKYQRTFQLQRRFLAQRRGREAWSVINRTPYAAWVIKKGMQNRAYHKGRWWIFEDEMEKSMPDLTKALAAELERELDRQ